MVHSGEDADSICSTDKMSTTTTAETDMIDGVDLKARQLIITSTARVGDETHTSSSNVSPLTIQKVRGGQWNQTRADVPPLLIQAGVPAAIWQETFDESCHRNADCLPAIERLAAARRRARPIYLIVLVVTMVNTSYYVWQAGDVDLGRTLLVLFFQLLCLLLLWLILYKPMREQATQSLAWFRFTRDQMILYRRYGICVQLLVVPNPDTTALLSSGCKNAVLLGGLGFKLVTDDSDDSTTPSLDEELKQLDTLIVRQAWALGRAEYAAAVMVATQRQQQQQQQEQQNDINESSCLKEELSTRTGMAEGLV